MSQSPVDDFSDGASLRYKQGWRALNRLLHEDRAFSGRERHCAFLNLGGASASFATVSSVTGFDFPEDGRGLATVDWDFDGDLDVWLTNRTAPRVRFLKNQSPASPFVAFSLRGDGRGTNRDAIGARLELHVVEPTSDPVRIRSLRGGEGFLSQSSNWIHFALGDAREVEKLVVRWPGGDVQEFRGMAVGNFYRITQGHETAAIFHPPKDRQPLPPSAQAAAAIQEAARIMVPIGFPMPELEMLDADGRARPWVPTAGRPTVVNLWAPWCAPCLEELKEWTAQRDAITSAGVDVVAFNVDGLGGEAGAVGSPEEGATVLTAMGFPFQSVRATSRTLHTLDAVQRAILDRWKPLPLPCTFLMDGQGMLVAIYKGPVTASQWLADVKIESANARRAAAVPFDGIWVDEMAGRADPRRLANVMLDHDDADAAIAYLDRCVARLSGQGWTNLDRQLGDIHYMAGLLKTANPSRRASAIESLRAARDLIPSDLRMRKSLAQQLYADGRAEEAANEIQAAAQINPTDLGLRNELAHLYERLGKTSEARAVFESLLSENPKNALARYYHAGVLLKLRDPGGAIQNYRQTLTDAPRLLDAANDLARVLATHPDEAVRSGEEALALARRLTALTQERDAGFLDTLGLALANMGEFEEAAKAATQALATLPPEAANDRSTIQAHLESYQSRRPVRQR